MKFNITVLTPRVANEMGGDAPEIIIDHILLSSVLLQLTDNFVSSPNACVVGGVCDQATLDAIEADPKYLVLSSEEIINETI
ncbi:MAG: hypothetical protein JRC86_09670 [Deltaproteobacteria bacterium]|nr:hypothetical protein [Deltaproteobacteria bacterium]